MTVSACIHDVRLTEPCEHCDGLAASGGWDGHGWRVVAPTEAQLEERVGELEHAVDHLLTAVLVALRVLRGGKFTREEKALMAAARAASDRDDDAETFALLSKLAAYEKRGS